MSLIHPPWHDSSSKLNAGMTLRDEPGSVGPDRSAFAADLPRRLGWEGRSAVVVGEQVHGAEVTVVGREVERKARVAEQGIVELPGIDGLVTNRPEVMIGVFTADCVPVLVADREAEDGPLMGAFHAGREGTRLGIVRRGVEVMTQLGARPERCVAWIAPAISARHYEVSPTMAQDFAARTGNVPGVVTGPEGRHLDLIAANRHQLEQCGLKTDFVVMDGRCTFEEAGLFFSYRREGSAAGRMFTWVGVRNVQETA